MNSFLNEYKETYYYIVVYVRNPMSIFNNQNESYAIRIDNISGRLEFCNRKETPTRFDSIDDAKTFIDQIEILKIGRKFCGYIIDNITIFKHTAHITNKEVYNGKNND